MRTGRFRRAIFGVMVVIFAAAIVCGQKIVTVADNVDTALTNEEQSLINSYDVIRIADGNVYAFPHHKTDGTYDHRLWDFVRKASQSGEGKWLHDNPLLSWLWQHGKQSYRIKGRSSLHIMFFFNKRYPGGMLIKMHVDRFAPSWSSPVNSTRHLVQELIPNIIFGRETDQSEIEFELRQKYKSVMPQ